MKVLKLFSFFIAFALVLAFIKLPQSDAAPTPETDGQKLKDAVVLFVGSPVALVNNAEVQIDSSNALVKPYTKSNRTLIPVSFIAQSFGARIGWNPKTFAVTVTFGKKTVQLALGNNRMLVNGKATTIEVPAETSNGRTFIPLSALANALGKKVFYDRGLIIVSSRDNIFDKVKEKAAIDRLISKVNTLPVLGSYENLKKLIPASYNNSLVRGMDDGSVLDNKKSAQAVPQAQNKAAIQSGASDTGASADYSTTNVQVEGVDEADVVKTDGEYIYQVNKQRIVIAKAYPPQEMKVASMLDFTDKSFSPSEIYIDEKKLIIIGSSYNSISVDSPKEIVTDRKVVQPIYARNQTVKAMIFDISDKANLKKLREVELEGNYVSSRKIGSSLYLIANRNLYLYYSEDDTPVKPFYRDTAVKNDYICIQYPEIRYFPGFTESNYMIVAGVNLDKLEDPANISTYLGSGQNIYASEQNLYVAVTNYNRSEVELPIRTSAEGGITASSKMTALRPANSDDTKTLIYKFSLTNSKVTYLSKGEVPGTILNQFSMDENAGYFRIATTKGNVWRTDEGTSKNNLFVLNDVLSITGKVEDIAPGEQIKSVRFMGNRAYVVTFKTVDPFFVLDLKDPANPKLLGALKIPGYSQYLHPYDENHIIGIGKDAVEVTHKDSKGNATGTTAYYLGMKISMFDVTDAAGPKEMFTQTIGDRGTESEILNNHKALLFSKDKNLIAFPIMVREVKDKFSASDSSIPPYGQFTFQGAYIYNIDLVNGFTLKGTITHLSKEDQLKAGDSMADPDKSVERIIYIGDTLYTLSKSMIKANHMSDLKEKGILSIP